MEVLESKTYPSLLGKHLQTLREKNISCDAKISAEGGVLFAHKCVLQAASPYISSYFSSQYGRGSDNSTVYIENVSVQIVEKVVDFMYTGKLEICYEDFDRVLEVCEKLEISFAVNLCQKYKKKLEKLNIWGQVQSIIAGDTEGSAEPSTLDQSSTSDVDHKIAETSSVDSCTDSNVYIDDAENADLAEKREIDETDEKDGDEEDIPLKKLKLTIKLDSDTCNSVVDAPDETVIEKEKKTPKVKRKKSKTNIKLKELIAKTKAVKMKANKVQESIEKKKTVRESSSDTDNRAENQEIGVVKSDSLVKSNSVIKSDCADEDNKEEISNFDDELTDLDYAITPDIINPVKQKKVTRKRKPKSETPKKTSKKPGTGRRFKQYPCSFCSRILTNQKRLAFHEYSKHGTPFDESRYTMYPCTVEGCDYVSGSKSNLRTHLKSRHEEERPHTCEFCGKSFKLPSVLAIHLNIHTANKQWKCDTCSETFNQQSGLRTHIKRHHMGESTWGELCHLCSEKFLHKSDLRWHLFKTHGQPLPDKYKVYECELCKYQTKSSQDLQRHVNAHNGVRQYNCSICNKSCSTKSQLKRHEQFHGEKKFKCTFGSCTYACVDSMGLKKHITLMHTHKNVKPYICPVCNYKTGVKGNLDKHIRQVHFLDVVTKHTVHLKMKYANFESGDIITKEGQLVATAKERKELYRRCMEENRLSISYQDDAFEIPMSSQDETDTSVKAILEIENHKKRTNEDSFADKLVIHEGDDPQQQKTLSLLKPMTLDLRQEPPSNYAVNLTTMAAAAASHATIPSNNVVYIQHHY